MAHLHSVYDGDTHFKIIPVSRKIENTTGKVILMQNDHNSERFTFEIPRYIEGHDMSICNKVEVHYNNTDTKTKDVNKDVYEATDLQVSPNSEDVVICSWLISGNATKYAGSLYFVLRFACLTDSTIDYQWFTDIYKDITISKSIFNTETVAIDNSDILEQWKAEIEALFNSGGSGSGGGVAESVVNEKIATAKRELIGGADDLTDADTIHAAKNLARGLVNGLESKVVKTTELNNAINSALLQAKESGEFDGADGDDGLSAYEIWLSQGNTGSEADFLESLKGKGGTSVTVSSVTESTADGGENIVTFSNGQTLKVKNGSKGDKGDAYTLTEEDKQEIAQNATSVCVAKNQGASNVGKILAVGTDGNITLVDMPEGGASGDVVGVLDESNNILLSGNIPDGTYTLKYENADGTYTEVGTLEVGAIPEPEEIVNQIPISTNSSGTVYNGTGFKSGARLSSDGVTEKTDATVCVLTGYIPAVAGDIIRTQNVTFGGSDTGYISQLWCYNASFGKVSNHSNATGIFGTAVDGIYTITVPSDTNIAYIRLQAQTLDDTSIVTVNQEIV